MSDVSIKLLQKKRREAVVREWGAWNWVMEGLQIGNDTVRD